MGGVNGEREHAMSMYWIAHLFPKEAIRIDTASIVHQGWVWKRSRHLGLWRKRWMVLTIDRHLLTFEDEMQRSGATDHFVVKSVLTEGEGPVEVEVTYPSIRRSFLQKLGMYQEYGAELKTASCFFDAGEKENREWCRALQGSLNN